MNKMVKHFLWTFPILLLCLFVSSCKTNKESEPEGKYKVDAEVVVVRKDGTVVSTTKLRGNTSQLRATG